MGWQPLHVGDDETATFARRFKRQAKFYLDESVSETVGDTLRQLRYKVKSYRDFSLSGHSDEDHFALCHREGMILVTHDRDFLDPTRFPDHRNPGVVVLETDSGSEEQLIRAAYFLGILVGPFGDVWRRSRILISQRGEVTVWARVDESGAVGKTRYRFTPHGPVQIWVDEKKP